MLYFINESYINNNQYTLTSVINVSLKTYHLNPRLHQALNQTSWELCSASGWLDGFLVAAAWTDLEKDAESILSNYSATGPTERLRDTAAKYSGALWTKRRAQELSVLS